MPKKKIIEKEKEVQISNTKPLGTPIPNKFLLMLVKNYIKSGD